MSVRQLPGGIKIKSDGTSRTTRVYCAKTGEDLTDRLRIRSVTWETGVDQPVAVAWLQCVGVEFEGLVESVEVGVAEPEEEQG